VFTRGARKEGGARLTVRATGRTRPFAVEVIAFMVLALTITWAAGSLVLLSNQAAVLGGEQHHPGLALPIGLAFTLVLVGDIGPALAALVTVAMLDGRRGMQGLLGQVARWRIDWYWYAGALIGPTAISLAAIGAFVAFGGRMDSSWIFLQPGRIALTAVGGWGEELGWRGFAQPRLQGRLGAAAAAVVVGVMWSIWHQWQLVAPGGAAFAWDAAGWSMLYLVSVSVLMAWMYNSTRASVPSAIAAHVGINAVRFSPYPTGFVSVVFTIVALVVAIITGPTSLVRRGTVPPSPLDSAYQ
jgi:membrane protease YdiL (CAAX protease family)